MDTHELMRAGDSWICKVCGWTWQSRPASRCPGRRRYSWRGAEAAGLVTKTTLGKEGLRLAPDQKPAGAVLAGDGRRYYLVYERSAAISKLEPTPAQLEALARGRETALRNRTCRDCGSHFQDSYYLDENGRCQDCSHRHWIREAGRAARAQLAALAAADDWLILDTETTGLDHRAEVISVAVVDADGDVVFEQLIRPQGRIPAEATAVHGLTAAILAHEPAFPDVYEEMAQLLAGRRILVYNADFDSRIIAQTCRRYGLATPAVAEWLCIMELFARYAGNWSNYHRDFRWISLPAACAQMGVDFGELQAHSAAGDALMTLRLIQKFAGKEGSGGDA